MSRTVVPPWPIRPPPPSARRATGPQTPKRAPLTADTFCVPSETFPSLEALQHRAAQFGFALSEGCLVGGSLWDFACEENDFSGCEWNLTVEHRTAERAEEWIVKEVQGEHNHQVEMSPPQGVLPCEAPLPLACDSPPAMAQPSAPWRGDDGYFAARSLSHERAPPPPSRQAGPPLPPDPTSLPAPSCARSSMSVPVPPSHDGPHAVRIKREHSLDRPLSSEGSDANDQKPAPPPDLYFAQYPSAVPPPPCNIHPAFSYTIRNAKNLPGLIYLEPPPPHVQRIFYLDDSTATMYPQRPDSVAGADPDNVLVFPPECPDVWMDRLITPAEDWRIFLKGMALWVGTCNGTTHHYQYFQTQFVRRRGEPQIDGLLPKDPWRRPAEILQHMARCDLHQREYLTKLCKRLLAWKEAGKLRNNWVHHHQQVPPPVQVKRPPSEEYDEDVERPAKRPLTELPRRETDDGAQMSPSGPPKTASSAGTLSPLFDHAPEFPPPYHGTAPLSGRAPLSLPAWLSALSPQYVAYAPMICRLGITFDDCVASFLRLPLIEDKLAHVLEARAGIPVLHSLDISREMVAHGRAAAGMPPQHEGQAPSHNGHAPQRNGHS